MFKKLVVSTVVLAVTSGVAFAGHHASYKGEKDYKNEVIPCPKYVYQTGAYVGLSAGMRNTYNNLPAAYEGLDGTLSLGYGSMMSPAFYLAGEIFASDSALIDNYRSVGGQGGVRTTWTYGASIIPGYMITDYVLGFVRLGAVSSHLSAYNNKSGWQAGLGAQTNVYQNWDVRSEYTFTGYSSANSASAGLFNVGVVYKFI